MAEIFDITKKNMPWIDKGQLHQIIVEIGDIPNADIQYKEGYLDADGNFISCGVNKLHVVDREEEKDEEGNITQEASSDFSEFLEVLANTQSPDLLEGAIKDFLVNKLKG